MEFFKLNDIKHLSLIEAIRLRPTKYIKYLDQRGIEFVLADLLRQMSNCLVRFKIEYQTIHLNVEGVFSSVYRKPFELESPLFDEFSQIYILACLSSHCQLLMEGEDNIVLEMKGQSGNFECNFQSVEYYAYKHGKTINFTFTPDPRIFKDLNLNYYYFLDFFQIQSYLVPHIIEVEFLLNRVTFSNRGRISAYANLFIHRLRQEPKTRIDQTFNIDHYSFQWTIGLMDVPFWDNCHIEAWVCNEATYGGSLHEGIIKGISNILMSKNRNLDLLNSIFILIQIKGGLFSYKQRLKVELDMPALESKITEYIVHNEELNAKIF